MKSMTKKFLRRKDVQLLQSTAVVSGNPNITFYQNQVIRNKLTLTWWYVNTIATDQKETDHSEAYSELSEASKVEFFCKNS